MEKKTNVKALAGIFIFAVAAMASNMTMGILGSIIGTYSEIGGANMVQYVLTGPALIGTLYAFVVGTINKSVPAKQLLIIAQVGMLAYGMIFWLLGGKAPIILLVIASGLVGLNQGSMNTLVGLMLVDVVPDEQKRGSTLGIITAVMNVGGVIITTLGGMISDATGKWQSAYVLFLYYIVAIILELFLLPNVEPEGKAAPAAAGDAPAAEGGLPIKVWLLSIHYLFFFLWLYVFGTNCSEFITRTYQIGTDADAGFAASTITIGGVIAGVLFGAYSKVLGKFTVPFCMALATIGLAVPVFVHSSVIGIDAAGIMCGFGMMGANPYIIGYLAKVAPGAKYGKAMSVFAGFMNAGMVVAIPVLQFLAKMVSGDPQNVPAKFVIAFVGMIVVTATSPLIYCSKDK